MNRLLDENWLESLPDTVADNMEKQNAEIIEVICRRIKYFGDLRPTEVKKLTNSIAFAGADFKEIEEIIKKYTGLNSKEIKKIFEQAAHENDCFAKQYYEYRGLSPITHTNNAYLQNIYCAIAEITLNTFENLSDTYGFKFPGAKAVTLRRAYTQIIDKAIYEIQTGVTDYNTAMRQSVKKLADSGVRVIRESTGESVVRWESGYSRRVDSSARMNILDGVRRLNQEMLLYHGEKFGSDGVELSAHAISAPDHMYVQGHQFSNEEFNKMQSGQSCADVNGREYEGFERPIGEWNCKHFAFPIVIGVSEPTYSEEQLENLRQNSRKKYDATQEMRKRETEIRRLKDRRMAYSAAGNELDAKRTQREINQKQKEYNKICSDNGLSAKPERTRVEGYKRISTVDNSVKNDIINLGNDKLKTELENQRYGRNKNTVINKSYIDSGEYKRKFDAIDELPLTKKNLYIKSKEMLKHRSGTVFEDMYWIDSETGNIVASENGGNLEEQIAYSKSTRDTVDSYSNHKLIALHSHPNSMPPSIADFNSCFKNKYKCGYIACHNGKLFAYTADEEISPLLNEGYIAKFISQGYSVYEAQMMAINKLAENHKISLKEVL